ncbi:MAG TPA: RidA family protein [Candidatus Dormibacteraeota bacterium]|nr:RidA family protein [Candidatus Dormibacteraeota bacterium]
MMRDVVTTDGAPKPIGPYSQALKVSQTSGLIFASGQVAIDPHSGQFAGGDIRQQTKRVVENLKAVLEAAGSNLHKVVKTTVFLKDMNDFAAMNEVYSQFFPAPPPARSTVEVARLPKDALVEIDAIATN